MMTQYAATKTRNLLVVKENSFQFRGGSFQGLLDEDTGILYDHPDDSFCKSIGAPTSIEIGLIYLIEETTPLYQISQTSDTLTLGDVVRV
jgi:hypothetical protein